MRPDAEWKEFASALSPVLLTSDYLIQSVKIITNNHADDDGDSGGDDGDDDNGGDDEITMTMMMMMMVMMTMRKLENYEAEKFANAG